MKWRYLFWLQLKFKQFRTPIRTSYRRSLQVLRCRLNLTAQSTHLDEVQNCLNRNDAASALIHLAKARQQKNKIPRSAAFDVLAANGNVSEAYALYRGRKISELLKGALGSKYVNNIPELVKRSSGKNQKILILASDGPGDELHFGCYYKVLIGHFGSGVSFTCDPRLATLMRLSFPDNEFIPVNRLHRFWETANFKKLRVAEALPKLRLYCALDDSIWMQRQNYDSVCLLLDLLTDLVPRDGLTPIGSYLAADPTFAKNLWRQWDLADHFTVGLSWRSTFTNKSRIADHFAIEECKVLFDLKGVKFLILQAKLKDFERKWLMTHYPDRVVFTNDLDVYDDLPGLASAISQVDMVISTGNYVVEMAAALGRPSAILSNNPSHRYRRNPNTKVDLMFPTLLHCEGDHFGDKAGILRAAANHLINVQMKTAKRTALNLQVQTKDRRIAGCKFEIKKSR
jgi:hypothetical protein